MGYNFFVLSVRCAPDMPMLQNKLDRFNTSSYFLEENFQVSNSFKIYSGCLENQIYTIHTVETGLFNSIRASWTINGSLGKSQKLLLAFKAKNMIHQSKDIYLWNVQADWNMCFNLMCEDAGYA